MARQSLEDYIEGRLAIGSCVMWVVGIFVAIVLCFTDPMFAILGIAFLVVIIIYAITFFVKNPKSGGGSSPKQLFKDVYFSIERQQIERERHNETLVSMACPRSGRVINFTYDDIRYQHSSMRRCKECSAYMFIDNYKELRHEFEEETNRRVLYRWNAEGRELWQEVKKLQQEKTNEVAVKYECQNCGRTNTLTWNDTQTSNSLNCTGCHECLPIDKEALLRRFYWEFIDEARSKHRSDQH